MTLILIVVGWLYVVVMMAAAEAIHPNGGILGAVFTFVLYGLGPVALVVWFGSRKARRAARQEREARAAAAASGQPDGSGEAPADAVAPVREEP